MNATCFRDFLECRTGKAARRRSGCLIVGEVGLVHDGSLGMAHAYIDGIAQAGADAVKFQTHIAEAESGPGEPWRVKFSFQDHTRYDYWKRTAFTEEQWRGLRQHAQERGLLFLSSPFSLEAVQMLHRVGVAAWKVASGEINNAQMLDCMAATGLPILLSTGMSPLGEIDSSVERVQACDLPLAVLQCSSSYPCPPEKLGLNLIAEFRERYGCAVGLSDHSGTIFAGLAAATLGIDVLEVHVAFSRELFGPDIPASVTTAELKQLVDGIRFIEQAMTHRVDKDALAAEMVPLRSVFMKSIVARVDLPEGTILREEHLAVKKPNSGIPADRLPDLLNRRLKRSIAANALLREDDLES
jgi:N-acetylneuraminate synthase